MRIKYLTVLTMSILSLITVKVSAQSLTWLGTLGGNTSKAFDVSDDGKSVVGTAQDSGGQYKAFVWKAETGIQNLGTFGGNSSSASGISASGNIIAGTAIDSLLRNCAFIYVNGVLSDIDPFGLTDTYANNISPLGSIIVGSYSDSNSYQRAYYFAGSSLIDIGTLGGESSEAFSISGGINPKIVGRAQTSNFEFHAFRNHENQMDDLGTLGGSFSTAIDISNNGEFIVGYSNGINHNDHAFIWTDTSGMRDIGTLGAGRSEAWSVSDNRLVVGSALTLPNGLENAFLWSADSGMQNLNILYSNLIPVTGKLTIARSISADGRFIVGTGYRSNPQKYEAFLLDRGDITNVEDEKQIPSEFNLTQNYPNPFNPTTKIRWQSPVGSHQTLKVYDVLGNEVATFVDEYREAGSYEVEFNASNLSSGIYFYKLSAGAFIETKKMILLR